MSQPSRLKVLSFEQALRIAVTSAWPVGSFADVTWFQPSAITSPSRTITAPNGPPWLARICRSASAAARSMRLFSSIVISLQSLARSLRKAGSLSDSLQSVRQLPRYLPRGLELLALDELARGLGAPRLAEHIALREFAAHLIELDRVGVSLRALGHHVH